MVLGFHEMREEDQPDEAIWLDEPQLADHFEAKRIARRADADPEWDATATQNQSEQVEAMLAAAAEARGAVKR